MPYKISPKTVPKRPQSPQSHTIYLSSRPHIDLPLPLHLYPRYLSCLVLDWWRSLLMLDVFVHDLSVAVALAFLLPSVFTPCAVARSSWRFVSIALRGFRLDFDVPELS